MYYCKVKLIVKKYCLLVILLSIQGLIANAQKKKPQPKTNPAVSSHILTQKLELLSYEIMDNGDTINKLDGENRRQGKWLITMPPRYGEEGLMEYGTYLDNKKVGKWQTYSLNGDLTAEEIYKSGNKDGEAKYYEQGRLFCIGNFLALKATQLLDTILVEDPITGIEKPVVIATEMGSVRHGNWTYFNMETRKIEKIVAYQVDDIVHETQSNSKVDSLYIQQREKSLPHRSNELPVNVWMLDKTRKAPRFTEFPENTQYVKPNSSSKKKK